MIEKKFTKDQIKEFTNEEILNIIIEFNKLSKINYKISERKRKTKFYNDTMNLHQAAPGRLYSFLELQNVCPDKHFYYLCLCDCGKLHICRSDAFVNSTSNGGCWSCGCLNNEKRLEILNSKEVIDKRNLSKEKRLELDGKLIKKNDEINDWIITDVKTENKRRYIKGICPICHKESDHWIRADSIKDKTIKSCGCLNGYESLGVKQIKALLQKNNISFETEKTFKDCLFTKTRARAKFDFFIPLKYYLIEYDGEQHYKPYSFGKDLQEFGEMKQRDQEKNEYCIKNNIPLIRIPYWVNEILLEDLIPETSKYLIQGESDE